MADEEQQILVLRQDQPHQQRYMISWNTQVGRFPNLQWATDRPIPKEFSKLEVLIQVLDSKALSRNHAAILRYKDGFYIKDLNSKNGTRLNEINLNPSKVKSARRKLRIGDRINFCTELELQVEAIKSQQDNYAILVGSPGSATDALPGLEDTMSALVAQLDKRGYRGNIVRLYDKEATSANVLNALEQAAYHVTPQAHFLFYFAGHGHEEGLKLGYDTLTPRDFHTKLYNIRGSKAVILDCCHAGVFKNWLPPQTLLLAASKEDGPAIISPREDGGMMNVFTAALVDYLAEHRGHLNLKELKDYLTQKVRIDCDHCLTVHYQEPVVEGSSFSLLTARSHIYSRSAEQ